MEQKLKRFWTFVRTKFHEDEVTEETANHIEEKPIAPHLAKEFKDKETVQLLEDDSIATGG